METYSKTVATHLKEMSTPSVWSVSRLLLLLLN